MTFKTAMYISKRPNLGGIQATPMSDDNQPCSWLCFTKEKQWSEVCKWTLLTFQNFLLPPDCWLIQTLQSLVLNFSHYVAKLKVPFYFVLAGDRKRYLYIYGKTSSIIINTRYCFQYFYPGKLCDLQFNSEIWRF